MNILYPTRLRKAALRRSGLIVSLLISVLLLTIGNVTSTENQVLVITISGPIGPATSDYVLHGFEAAENAGAELVVLKMDTPGGLDIAMRDIIQGILSSSVPVATFVSPRGARAASAGTYILYASHIAAMAPATTLGAATPIAIGGMPEFPGMPEKPKDDKTKDDEGAEEDASDNKHLPDAMQRKMVNDAAAYIRGLAQLRNRNVEWAEQAVRRASSLSAEEAVEINVVDLLATDLEELLEKLHNQPVTILNQERELSTETATVVHHEPDWRNELLSIITDPNILPILMTLGMFGLIYEMLNPGFVLPGVLGGICILLALYAAQVLPINYAGLALIILGILFIIGEVFVPSFGALGIGGAIAIVFGSIILIDTDLEGYGVSIPFMSTFAALNALFVFFIISMVIKSRKNPVVSGSEELIGSTGQVLEAWENAGRVRVHSEIWEAKSPFPIQAGDLIRVTGLEGLTLMVEPESSLKEKST